MALVFNVSNTTSMYPADHVAHESENDIGQRGH